VKNLNELTAVVVDNGLFPHVAFSLAEKLGRVLYWTPAVNAFPSSNCALPGDGFAEIQRIRSVDQWEDKADIFVFPDVMYGWQQDRLRRAGKLVFGAGRGEVLELDRWATKKILRRLGMPVAESHLIQGLDALRNFLENNDGQKWWIKTSYYRGDFETFDVESYLLAKERLDELAARLGRKAEIYPFIVERDIPAIIEVGYDGACINGQFAPTALFGVERKDTGYIGIVKPYAELPEPVQWVNAQIAGWMAERHYCGFFSSELRLQELAAVLEDWPEVSESQDVICTPRADLEAVPGTSMLAFLTDPCCRAASPPSELYIEWVSNWPEFIVAAARGELIDIEPVNPWGVEIMLHSAWADKNWQSVHFPEELRRYVKLRNVCKIKGMTYSVPQGFGLPEIGAVVATGETLLEACELAKERAGQVQGYFIEPKIAAIPEAIAEIERAQAAGIDFTGEKMPDDKEIVAMTKGDA
jgi:hypothetical protein